MGTSYLMIRIRWFWKPIEFMRYLTLCMLAAMLSCQQQGTNRIHPKVITAEVMYDSDDPAFWIHPDDPSKSLILGTDKEEVNGAIYVFNLKGEIVRTINQVDRPNNVDVRQGVVIGTDTMDIAVYSERNKSRIRVMSLPDFTFIDGNGIPVFQDSDGRDVMGISLFKRPTDSKVFAVVSRKENPEKGDEYLYQYLLEMDSSNRVVGRLVRKFGQFSGTKEIEAIAVDDEMGFIYYSDEACCIRKYHADPEMGNTQLTTFATSDFKDDREGISIYKTGEGEGYIIVSDQGADRFQVYQRSADHSRVGNLYLTARQSDGSEVTNQSLGRDYPLGIFVAMSDNKTFEFYDWRELNVTLDSIKNTSK